MVAGARLFDFLRQAITIDYAIATGSPRGSRDDARPASTGLDSSCPEAIIAPMSSPILENVRTLAEKVATAQDVEVYHVELSGGTVRVLVEGPQGISLGACSRFSRELSSELDRAGLFQGRYFIEVSSPGVERRLYRPRDFERAVNRRIRVRTRSGPLEGMLVAADERGFVISFEDRSEPHTGRVTYEDVKEARLAVPDSELFCKPVVTQRSAARGAGPDPDAPGGKGTDE